MRRLPGTMIAAAILAFFTILGFLFVLLSTSAMFVTRYPLIPHTPQVMLLAGVVNGLFFLFLVWCAWTVLGLLRGSRGAQRSMIAIGAISATLSGLGAAEVFHLRSLIPAGLTIPGQSIQISTIAVCLGLLYAAATLINLWLLLYFSLPHVRQAFQNEPAAVHRPQ